VPDWVLAAERAYVAAAVGHRLPEQPAAPDAVAPDAVAPDAVAPDAVAPDAVAPDAAVPPDPAAAGGHTRAGSTTPSEVQARAIAAAGAVASRFLAVGTPRSFGIVIDDATEVDAAALSLTAHRTWFAPRDIRCAATASGADELAAATGGRVVSVAEALACDIVNIYSTRVRITPAQLRRGTHVNAGSAALFEPELLTLATVVDEAGLPALAAGLVDGRQLDELTIFIANGAPIAASAAARPA